MNRKELIRTISENTNETIMTVSTVIDSMVTTITEALEEGDNVQLIGFGTFSVTKRKARKGHNPATGESINIAASKGVKFKVGSKLKDAVKNS
jgi:DNA-binding protein HU-beta